MLIPKDRRARSILSLHDRHDELGLGSHDFTGSENAAQKLEARLAFLGARDSLDRNFRG